MKSCHLCTPDIKRELRLKKMNMLSIQTASMHAYRGEVGIRNCGSKTKTFCPISDELACKTSKWFLQTATREFPGIQDFKGRGGYLRSQIRKRRENRNAMAGKRSTWKFRRIRLARGSGKVTDKAYHFLATCRKSDTPPSQLTLCSSLSQRTP